MSQAMNLFPQNGVIEEEDEQRPSQESSSLIQQSKNAHNARNTPIYQQNNQISSSNLPKCIEPELPLEISRLLAYDESLYDLMRHKASFKYYFGRDFQIPAHPSAISSNSQNPQQQQSAEQMLLGLEHIISNYACFNSFFFPKEHLTQKSVLEIHHSQNSEKTQLLHFLISELLRDSACRSTKDAKMIPPQILLFDNTQHFDYQLLKLSIKQKIIAANFYRPAAVAQTVFTQEALDSLEGLADSLSEECLEKLHVIQSRSQLEFAVNIRSLKQILNTKKSIRVVIIDSLNAFFIDNENTFNSTKAENDNSIMIPSDDHNNSASNYKKRRKNTNTRVGLQKQYDLVIKEYLEECYNKFNRVAFIQTRRDYYKIRNLIELSDSSGSLFKANDELSNLLSNDRIFTSPHAYKSPDCSYESTSIYTLSLDNFSNAALDKALQLLRNEQLQNGNQLNINPQKVSVVVKRNHLVEDPNDLDEEALAIHKERQQLSQFQYLMNFYCFLNNDFVPLSDNTYYF